MEDLVISSIVEGHGEVKALPIILRRLLLFLAPQKTWLVPEPIRIPKGSFLNRPDERRRALDLAAIKGSAAKSSFILILLDSDGECPAAAAPALLAQCKNARSDQQMALTFAHHEFEAWFIAAATSLRSKRGLPIDLARPDNPEAIQDAKGWLKQRRTGRVYSPTIDQPAFASLFDMDDARRHAPSFDKFCRDLESLVQPITDESNAPQASTQENPET